MKCVEVYKELYHQEPFDVAFCPYRISPLGAHIDHQYGKINGLAIDKGIHMAYHPKQNGVVELQSLNFPKRAQFFVNVELLLNSVERCIAIRPCNKNNPNAIRWGRLKEGRWCASTLGCRGLAKTLFDIMEWDEDLRYRFRGQFLEQGDNKMMLFAFDEPEMIKVEEIVLPPKENTEEDEGETVRKKIYIFPPEWAGTFGQPITSIAQVGILRQEHYAGNWDVFRPATEIEEMNIFTAESLNELLREAEKIMEGWTDYR